MSLHRRIRRLLASQAPALDQGWTDVAEPSGWSWSLPFTIQQKGRRFRIKPGFTLRGRAGITVVDTYYVDKVSGSNGNGGTSWSDAWADLDQVPVSGDPCRIYIADGSYFHSDERLGEWQRDCEFIGIGDVTITSDSNNLVTWTLDTNHYEDLTHSPYVARVRDRSNPNSYGDPGDLTARASEALVDANANSFYDDYGNQDVFVRTVDDRAPDDDILLLDSLAYAPTEDNRVYYFENIHFIGNLRIRNTSASGGLKAYFVSCDVLGGMALQGVDEAMLQNCVVHSNNDDGINIDARNGILSRVVEIDCTIYNCQLSTDTQCSTSHNACEVVRINGEYYDASGQVIADVLGAFSWNLGCYVHTSAIADHFYQQGATGKMWLDCCRVDLDGNYDISAVDGNVYVRDFLPAGYTTLESGTGAIASY